MRLWGRAGTTPEQFCKCSPSSLLSILPVPILPVSPSTHTVAVFHGSPLLHRGGTSRVLSGRQPSHYSIHTHRISRPIFIAQRIKSLLGDSSPLRALAPIMGLGRSHFIPLYALLCVFRT